MQNVITKEVAAKVLEVVDAGLVKGLGNPVPGQMCVEAAVCFAQGLPHSDEPSCVSRAVRSLKITLNDANWSTPTARAAGMRRVALAQLGSAGVLDDVEFARRVAEVAIRLSVPTALRAAASIHKDPHHKGALLDAAIRCETEGTKEASYAASYAASRAASRAASDAASAASYAASDAASDAASRAASAASYAASRAASYAASYAASRAASDAASAASYAASDAASDKALADFAEGVVQVLVAMNAPGCEWLSLTETPAKYTIGAA